MLDQFESERLWDPPDVVHDAAAKDVAEFSHISPQPYGVSSDSDALPDDYRLIGRPCASCLYLICGSVAYSAPCRARLLWGTCDYSGKYVGHMVRLIGPKGVDRTYGLHLDCSCSAGNLRLEVYQERESPSRAQPSSKDSNLPLCDFNYLH